MNLHEYLEAVHDRQSFLLFVRALYTDRVASEHLAKDGPALTASDHVEDWQNETISDFLESGLAYLEDTAASQSPNDGTEPTWRTFAEFLYAGKGYE